MRYKKLTAAEEKRLADAFTAQALAMGLKGNKKLPKDIKLQVRDKVMASIEADRKAADAQQARRQEHEAAENTFTWKPAIRRR
jgi:hypothetical protein